MISISCTEAYSVFGAQQPQDITDKQCSSYMLQEPADRRIANPQKKNRKSQIPCNRGQGIQKTQQNTSLTWNAQYCDTEFQLQNLPMAVTLQKDFWPTLSFND